MDGCRNGLDINDEYLSEGNIRAANKHTRPADLRIPAGLVTFSHIDVVSQ